MIVKFEDIVNSPKKTIRKLYRFLKVDDTFVSGWINHKWTSATNLSPGIKPWKKKLFYTSTFSMTLRNSTPASVLNRQKAVVCSEEHI